MMQRRAPVIICFANIGSGGNQKPQTLHIIMTSQQAHGGAPASVSGAGIGTGFKEKAGTFSIRIVEAMLQQGCISAFVTGIHLSSRGQSTFPHLRHAASEQKAGSSLHALRLRHVIEHHAGNRGVAHPVNYLKLPLVASCGISPGSQQQSHRINAIIPNGEHQRGAATAIARIHGHPLLQQLTHSLSITATGSI
jgi:hypothetical protein